MNRFAVGGRFASTPMRRITAPVNCAAAALRSTSEQQRPRASKSASREIFRNRTASRGRSAAYRFGAYRENPYAYEKPRQDRQSLQTDPVGYEADNNLYLYVGNDPLNRTDPTGMRDKPCYLGCNIRVNNSRLTQAITQTVDQHVTQPIMSFSNSLTNIATGNGTAADYTNVTATAAIAIATDGIGAAIEGPVASRAAMAETGSTSLFRVVAPAERADIAATGAFRIPGGGLETKQFVTSAGDANALRSTFDSAFGPGHTVVGATVPEGVATESFTFSDVPGRPMEGVAIREPNLSRVCPVLGPC